MLTITAEATFTALHHLSLPDHLDPHHHTYIVTVEYTGQIVDGMLPDYEAVDDRIEAIVRPLHGADLNATAGLPIPTTEAVVFYVMDRLELPDGGILVSLTVDKDGSRCTWRSPMHGVNMDSLGVRQHSAFPSLPTD